MNFFNDRSTSTKLFFAFGLITAFTCAVGWLGTSAMKEIVGRTDTMMTHDLEAVLDVEHLRMGVGLIGRDVRRAVLTKDDAEERKYVEAARKDLAEFEANLTSYLRAHRDAQGHTEAFRTLEAKGTSYTALQRKALEAVDANDDDRAAEVLAEAAGVSTSVEEAVITLEAANTEEARQGFLASERSAASARSSMIGLLVVAALIAIIAAWFVSSAISNGLKESARVLDRVATGDFTSRMEITSKDEMGQMAAALNQTVTTVRDALDEVREVAADVAAASSQLSASSQDISSGAQEQASSLEETAASLEEITGTIKQNSDNAQQAAQLAAAARGVADKGRVVVTSAVAAMGEISQSSERIVDIISTIDDIAFQTNLLALNAAVEAARAGEQGRGFAVVATEVRNLAHRSATSAREIKSLIQESVKRIDGGTRLVNQSGASLEEIVGGVKRVTDIVGEIAAASREQSTGIEQVNKAVTQMDGVTQSNAGQTEELSATASNLSARATQLQELVGRFVLEAQGTRRAASTASTPRRLAPAARVPKKKRVLGSPAAERADGAFGTT